MLKPFMRLAICSALTAGSLFSGFFGSQALAFSDQEKTEIGSVVRQYILDNPSVITEALTLQKIAEQQKADQKVKDAIAENYATLTAKDLPSIGSDDADVTIVEFFDYNCGYCKMAVPDIVKLVKADKKIRVVFHELPILSPASRTAAQYALAAHKQGKYFEYHQALMEHRGHKNDGTYERLGKQVGLDTKKLKKDAKSEIIKKDLLKTANIAQSIGVGGTPAFIIGDQFYGGYIRPDMMKQAIDTARKQAAINATDESIKN